MTISTLRDTAAKALTDAGLGDVPMQAIDIVTAVSADAILAAGETEVRWLSNHAADAIDRARSIGAEDAWKAAADLIRTAPPTEASEVDRG